MLSQTQIDFATQGGCGLVAREVLELVGGVPVLWYDEDGNAIHAAIRVGGLLVHLGSREDGYTEVSVDELGRAIREDFREDDDENRELARLIAREISEDFID